MKKKIAIIGNGGRSVSYGEVYAKQDEKDGDDQLDINAIVDSLESEELLKKRYNDQDARSASQKTSGKYLFEERWKRKQKGIDEMSIPEFALYSIRIFAIMFTVLSSTISRFSFLCTFTNDLSSLMIWKFIVDTRSIFE